MTKNWFINHVDDEYNYEIFYDRTTKSWVNLADKPEGFPIPAYSRKRGKLPEGGYWISAWDMDYEQYEMAHLGCPNYPNCDTEGCGY